MTDLIDGTADVLGRRRGQSTWKEKREGIEV